MCKTNIFHCDNLGAVEVAQNQAATGRTKHLDIRLLMINDLVAKKENEVKIISSSLNVVDMSIKPLGRLFFRRIAEAITESIKFISRREC